MVYRFYQRDENTLITIKIDYNFDRVEKYRPSTLQDLVSHEDIIKTSEYIADYST